MDDLINKDDFKNAAQLDKWNLGGFTGLLMRMLQVPKINKLYKELHSENGLEFINAILEHFNITYEIPEADLKKIPATGPFVVVSNHPFGALDGLLLIKIIGEVRPDFKVMANFILKRIPQIADFIVPVNPFDNHDEKFSSFSGLKEALLHLQKGSPLAIFPAGEVSSYQSDKKSVSDRPWHPVAVRFVHRTAVPVIPVFFQGNNSAFYQLISMIHPMFRTSAHPRELLQKKNIHVRLRIGAPIPLKEMSAFEDLDRYGRYLRARTYALGSALEVKRFFHNPFKRPITAKPLADQIPKDVILKEVDGLKDCIIHTQQNFDIYITPSARIPFILKEIGRLREETFRLVGEGTNLPSDLDEYDLYYHHLFIFDNVDNELVGAYRLGKGKEILQAYGVSGFYTNSLFSFDPPFKPYLEQTIELGRSFVSKKYQQKLLPLFLLWKGILFFLLKNTEYRYLLGPVSISNVFSQVSRSLIVQFIQENYFNHDLAKLVHPKKKFHVDLTTIDKEVLIDGRNDISVLDKLISEIEPNNFNVPVLLKKYIKQNAKIIGFNLDPKFSNALDGLMILDLHEVPKETIESLKKEFKNLSE